MRWWIRMLAAVIAVVLLGWLGWNIVNGFTGLLGGMGGNFSEPDPMFAMEAELPTRPPELDAEEAVPNRPTLDDYIMEEGAPVDKTAEELISEAMANS